MEVVARRADRFHLDGIVTAAAPTDAVRDLKRQVTLYRVVLVVIVVFAAAVYLVKTWMLQPPAIEVFDVAREVDQLAAETPDWLDVVPSKYFKSESATVHLHVMGRDQTCPLHLHAKTEEATVIVKGSAEVEHVFGRDGAAVDQTTKPSVGTVLYSPTYCGHEWRNTSKDVFLGNLVFTAPAFAGNHYVKKDHPLLLRGAAPTVLDPDAEIAAAAGKRRETPLPMAGGRMRMLVLTADETLSAKGTTLIVYALRGQGSLEAGKSVALMPHRLVIVRGRSASLRPSREGPLAALVFEPP
jgi:hypothetical protein